MSDLVSSYVRTYVPILVGLIVTFLVGHGYHLSPQQTASLSAVISAAFYGIVRLAEHYLSPKFGWLLGLAKTPAYVTPPVLVTSSTGTTTLVDTPAAPAIVDVPEVPATPVPPVAPPGP